MLQLQQMLRLKNMLKYLGGLKHSAAANFGAVWELLVQMQQ
jgi:hypothetical protein